MATAIHIDGLSKAYGSGAARSVAVDGVRLEIAPGELFFLLGPSGCGKTTLLRMLAGFIEPTAGRVLFNGRDVTKMAASRRNTGMVFQSYALWPHMTVEANVAFGLGVRRVPAAQRAARLAEALETVRMTEYAKRRPNQLSGGQQQRVALARALVVRPDVLLLDEPLSNLDAKLRIELRAEIRRICKAFRGDTGNGITTVYVTHDQKEALSMADRIAVLDRGRLVQVGAPQDLYRRPATRFVAEFLGETNLIEGTVIEVRDRDVVVRTPMGPLLSTGGGAAKSGDAVLCSVRPEAIAFARDPGAFGIPGTLVEATYLGDTAHYVVEAAGNRVRVATLNPRAESGLGRRVVLAIEPGDVHMLTNTKR
jgi:iron(III) transport system ATP-binding protein